jgi:hypothetical protein
MKQVIKAYATASAKLINRYNSVSSLNLFKPVIDLLPSSPARVVDVGAGPGRDAAWLANTGIRSWRWNPSKNSEMLEWLPIHFRRLSGLTTDFPS